MRTRFTFAATAMAVAAILAACGQGNQYVAPPLPKVTVSKPAKQPVTRYLDSTGEATFVRTVFELDREQEIALLHGRTILVINRLDESVNACDQVGRVHRRGVAGRVEVARDRLLGRLGHRDLRQGRRHVLVALATGGQDDGRDGARSEGAPGPHGFRSKEFLELVFRRVHGLASRNGTLSSID